jgi:putative ABC transport system permease protein
MIRTYIRLALRSLFKNKVFSFINVFGLAIGLTSCLLIAMYLFQELSYDAQHKNSSRLYQVGTLSVADGKEDRFASTPGPLAPLLQQDYPEIESTTRLLKAFQDDKTLLQYGDGKELKSFYETAGYFVDSTYFKLFTYQFTEGNPATALDQPNALVLSEEIAKKIFGNEPALNKVVHINSTTNGEFDFRVTGVFRPAATPSHIDARFFMSMGSGEVGPWVRNLDGILNNNLFYTYLLLKPGTDPKGLEAKFPAFVQKYAGEDMKAQGRSRNQFLTPLRDIHLHARTEGNVTPAGSVAYLYILASIALVTLLIACVNFMNLSTARSSKRALEIGVRKVLGAERGSLVRQFLWEAILLSLFAFVISLAFTLLLMPLFEKVSGKEFFFSFRQYSYMLLGFFVVSIIAGLVAGSYPAFYLSAFKPVKVLKGRFANSLSAISFRKVLVVFQFVISVALIVASITISNQMRYLRTKDLGFIKDQQVVIPLRTTTAKNIYPALKNELVAKGGVAQAGASLYYPGITNVTDWLVYKQGQSVDQSKGIFMNWVDDSYLQTLGIKPVAGRIFSKDFPGDTSNRALVINEQAVRHFGFGSPEEAVGKSLAALRDQGEVLYPIVGVVRDFHFKDLHNPIESYGFFLANDNGHSYLITRVDGNNLKTALANMGAAWAKLNPAEPFEYSFLDQDFAKNYEAEERLASIIRYFTIIAIFISCLGLFGLTTFSVEQRTKEIGIRKVLGASTAGLVTLLSKDFLKLVALSFLVASPLAWYFINNWLQSFAYRAPFSVWIIVGSWLLALLIAFFTISIQAIKVALTNPVKNLRTE